MDELISWGIFSAIYFGGIYYCYKVAKRIQSNVYLALVVGAIIPLGCVLIYNHLSHRHKNGSAPKKGIFE